MLVTYMAATSQGAATSATTTTQDATTTPCAMVYCFVDPCQVANCPVYPTATCTSDYCGGCYARFYIGSEEVTSSCNPPTTTIFTEKGTGWNSTIINTLPNQTDLWTLLHRDLKSKTLVSCGHTIQKNWKGLVNCPHHFRPLLQNLEEHTFNGKCVVR